MKFPLCPIWSKKNFRNKSHFHSILARVLLHTRFILLKYSFFLRVQRRFPGLKSQGSLELGFCLNCKHLAGQRDRKCYTASLLQLTGAPADVALHLQQRLQVENLCNYRADLSALSTLMAEFCCAFILHAKPQQVLKDRGEQSSLIKVFFSNRSQSKEKKTNPAT